MRLCNRCGLEKDESLFYKYSGLQSLMLQCKDCNIKAAKLYAKNNRQKVNKTKLANYHKHIEKNRAIDRSRYWNNPERRNYTLNNHKRWAIENPRIKRDLILKREYGISIENYESMLARQNHVCAICEKPESIARKGSVCSLVVDHCHTTGKIRGLLCNNCNRVLGLMKESKTSISRMVEYLNKNTLRIGAGGGQNPQLPFEP